MVTVSGHCKRYRPTGSHRATGPDSMWTLTPHTGPCGTYALNPVALCDTQRAVKEIVKRPSEQFSKRPWSNTHVYQSHRLIYGSYRYVPQGRLWVESSSIDSGPVALYLLQWPTVSPSSWTKNNIQLSSVCILKHLYSTYRYLFRFVISEFA